MTSSEGHPRSAKLSDYTYERIFELIVSGEFPESSKLPTELEIAERFKVSRAVVREALARLRDDELIYSRQGSGSYVQRRPDRSILRPGPVGSIADIQRCFEFRVSLEGETALMAALRHDAESLEAIEQALRGLDQVVTTRRLGVDEDYEFHLSIAKATGNRFYVSAMASLQSQIAFGMNLARNLSLTRPEKRNTLVQSEHAAIADAIRRRDPKAARTTMRTHLENARRRVFEGSESPSAP